MDEYIKRTEALDAICDACINYGDASNCASCLMVKEVRDTIPAADVVPVVRGHWEYHECVNTGEGIASVYACSECRSCVKEDVFESDEFHKTFCGNCGAKMDWGDGT